jgi:hypothetical protein
MRNKKLCPYVITIGTAYGKISEGLELDQEDCFRVRKGG